MKLAIKKNKEIIINEIINNFNKANSIIIIEYQNLIATEFAKIRKILTKQKVKVKIYKNNLVKLATKKIKLIELNKFLVGPNAFIFDIDKEMSSIKILTKFTKLNSTIKLKAGIYKEKILNTEEITMIASLPTKNELLLMFTSDLLYLLHKFLIIIKEIIKIKK